MKKWTMLLLGLVFLFGAVDAMAIGIGPYAGFEFGKASLKSTDDDAGDAIDFKTNHYTVGFFLDTATRRDNLFNYRLNVGVDLMGIRPDDELDFGRDPEKVSGWGFDMKHTFGFGVFRSEMVRVWLGPAIKLYYASLSKEDSWLGDESLSVLGIGGGPEVGVNINLPGGLFTVALSGGYNYNYVVASVSGEDFTAHGPEHMFYFQIAPVFNFGSDREAWGAESAVPAP